MVLTGAADEQSARATMEAGADDLLLKPLDFAQLERKLIAAGRVTELHARLHDNARHDALTGLSNRLRLAEDLELLCGRVERYGHAYCVALFDVDDFKSINDEFGHQQGDEVLAAVAGVLRELSRDIDLPARYGGEELAVVLPQTDSEGAALLAERMREAVERLRVPRVGGHGSLHVTASFGVAAVPASARDKEALLRAADEALYRAKRAGKNRVVRAG